MASRTQESTEEIQKMIEQLQSGVHKAVKVMSRGKTQADHGVEQVAKAGEALQQILDSVTDINQMTTMIATAAEEQAAVTEEINRNINNISDIAEETTEDAHHVQGKSEELSQLSQRLKSMIQTFKL